MICIRLCAPVFAFPNIRAAASFHRSNTQGDINRNKIHLWGAVVYWLCRKWEYTTLPPWIDLFHGQIIALLGFLGAMVSFCHIFSTGLAIRRFLATFIFLSRHSTWTPSLNELKKFLFLMFLQCYLGAIFHLGQNYHSQLSWIFRPRYYFKTQLPSRVNHHCTGLAIGAACSRLSSCQCCYSNLLPVN